MIIYYIMFGFSSSLMFGLAIVVSVVNTILLVLMSYRILLVFQQSGYRVRPFANWIMDKRTKLFIRLFSLALLSFGLMAIKNILFYMHLDNMYIPVVGVIFYIALGSVLIWDTSRQLKKIPLKRTPRLVRLGLVMMLLFFVISFFLVWLGSTIINAWVGFALIAITPLLLPEILLLSHYVIYPIEAMVRRQFITRAKRKLFSGTYENLVRIGITGSYGKTSCKDILATMLSKKFKVAKSPNSFNTPMGFSKTVNEVLEPNHEVLIMEMGLRFVNDIGTLCDLFKPQHGLLTSIGTAHIETMVTEQAIKIEKAKLVQALPKSGIAVLGQSCKEIFDELELENKHFVNSKDIKNIKVTKEGSQFELFGILCKTKLLGHHNIQNIATCAKLAKELGVEPELIAQAISELEPTPHRLQLVNAQNGVIILDDSYNASEQGTHAALEVLSMFNDAEKRVVQTPGIVELGPYSESINTNFAKRIAKVATDVIIVNDANKQVLMCGLEDAGFDKERIFQAKSLDDAMKLYQSILKSGDVLLLANDLPDLFN